MASKAGRQVQEFRDFFQDSMFIGRFIYDVLIYTLTKCGLPETSLPTTDCAENVYHRTDFVKIAGASVLWVSLTMRDKWKRMFISRRNSSGYSNKNVLEFVEKLAKCCGPIPTSCTQSLVKVLLALCNEIMMYFHLENIDIHFNNLIKLISAYIVGATGLNRNDPEKLEELFDNFDDISGYIDWINDFITRFAIPYGSRDDVSDRFFEHVREQYKDYQKKLKDSYRFLPHDIFSNITDGSETLGKPISTPSDSKSLEPPKLPTGSEIGAMEGKKSGSCQSTCPENVSEQIASEVGIEQDLEKMSLGVEETSPEIQGAKTKREKSEKDICMKKGS